MAEIAPRAIIAMFSHFNDELKHVLEKNTEVRQNLYSPNAMALRITRPPRRATKPNP
jgi:hypothetical protein